LHLSVHDPAYTDRLAAFLRSVGLEPRLDGSQQIEVDAEQSELEVYLRVWRVMNPDAAVDVSA
jgi:hypothetical protein